MVTTRVTADEMRDAAPGVRMGREEGSELTRVLAGIDDDQITWLERPRPRPRPTWFRESADERAAGKIRRALDLYEMRRVDTHLMMRILIAAHSDWERAEDAWIMALRAGADWQEVARVEQQELACWHDFTFAEELLDLCLGDQSSAGRRLFDAMHACQSAWDAVRTLLARALSGSNATGDSCGAEKGGVA